MATPMVAGYAAKLWMSNPTMTPKNVIDLIMHNSETISLGRYSYKVIPRRPPNWDYWPDADINRCHDQSRNSLAGQKYCNLVELMHNKSYGN